ncbi:MAG: hypothetical protein ACYCW6_06105 [Candidatus Xenobia bacterium]
MPKLFEVTYFVVADKGGVRGGGWQLSDQNAGQLAQMNAVGGLPFLQVIGIKGPLVLEISEPNGRSIMRVERAFSLGTTSAVINDGTGAVLARVQQVVERGMEKISSLQLQGPSGGVMGDFRGQWVTGQLSIYRGRELLGKILKNRGDINSHLFSGNYHSINFTVPIQEDLQRRIFYTAAAAVTELL